jgi:hypothetical protein
MLVPEQGLLFARLEGLFFCARDERVAESPSFRMERRNPERGTSTLQGAWCSPSFFLLKENTMLDKPFLKSYLSWLDDASFEELEGRHLTAVEQTKKLKDPEVRRDARYLLRLLEQEMLLRKNLKGFKA